MSRETVDKLIVGLLSCYIGLVIGVGTLGLTDSYQFGECYIKHEGNEEVTNVINFCKKEVGF